MSKKELPPFYSLIMGSKGLSLFVVLFPLAFIVLNLFFDDVWPCPMERYLSIQCPGCGMTRAAFALLRFDMVGAFVLHPFSIPLFLAWAFIIVSFFLPTKVHDYLLFRIEQIEKSTGVAYILVVAFVVFGLVRMGWQIHQHYHI